MSRSVPPRTPQRPPFPPAPLGQPSTGAYALIRVCLGEACLLPAVYRCPECPVPFQEQG